MTYQKGLRNGDPVWVMVYETRAGRFLGTWRKLPVIRLDAPIRAGLGELINIVIPAWKNVMRRHTSESPKKCV